MNKETQEIEEGSADEALESEVVAEEEVVGDEELPGYDQLALQLKNSQAKAEENWNQSLRYKAELENMRRRAERDVQNAHKFGLEKVMNELLPVKDSLETGLATAVAESAEISKVAEGLEMSAQMLASVMAKFGITEVNPEGEQFDPERHQAMSMQELPDVVPNTVVTVFQKGYCLNERLIRPAMVVVASAQSGSNLESGSDDSGPAGENSIDEMA